jgi:hypothetical protein
MEFGFARRGALALACLSISPAFAAAAAPDSSDEVVRARHPWARFQPGSWVELRTATESVVDGKKHRDVSTRRVTLKAVTDKGVKLATESKGIEPGDVDESTVPLEEESPWISADLGKAPHEPLTIEGREITCAVIHFNRTSKSRSGEDDADGHVVGAAWISESYPVPLKLELETTEGETSSRRRMVVEHLDVEIKVGDRSLHCVESVTNLLDEKGQVDPKSELRAWSCAEVPGTTVRVRARDSGEDGESISLTDLLDFFVAPTPPVTRVIESPPKPATGACVITGHFTLDDGNPGVGIPASVSGSTRDVRAVSKSGRSPEEVSIEGKTDAEGRIRFEIEALPGAEYFVEVRGPGLAKEEWRLRDLFPGHRVDLGDVKLQRSGSIVGTMTAPDGSPIPGGFYVMARRKGDVEATRGPDRESIYEYGMPEKGSTEYRVDNIPAGTYEVEPNVNGFGWFNDGMRTVEVTEGTETRLDLIYSGPDLSHRVRIVVFVQPFYTLTPRRDRVSMATLEGRTIAATHCDMEALDFDGVPDGPCTLTIDDPRFEKLVRTGLRGGSHTDITLRGAGSVIVIARDAENSKAIEDVAVSQEVGLDRFLLRGFADPRLENGLLEGVLPGDSCLFVKAKGYSEIAVELKDLKAGAPRTIEVALDAGGEASPPSAVVAGVVRDSKTAKPLAGVVVAAERSDGEWERKATIADGAGAYRLEGLPAGHWSVRATRGDTVASSVHRLELDAGERREDVDLVVPFGVDVVGNVFGLGVIAEEEPHLAFSRVEKKPGSDGVEGAGEDDASRSPGRQEVRVDRGGAYAENGIAPGRYRVELEYGGRECLNGPARMMNSPTQRALLADVEITDAANQRFDFDASVVTTGIIHARVECDASLRGFLLVVARPPDLPRQETNDDVSVGADDESAAIDDVDSEEEWFDEFANSVFDDAEGDVPGSIANLAPDGSARLVLPPGRWRIGARHSGGEWTIDAPELVEVKGGDEVEALIRVVVVPSSIRLVEAGTQRPLADESIRWLHSTSSRRAGVTGRTSGDGVLSLALPRGKVTLSIAPRSSRSKDNRAGAAEITWPPTDETVVLRRDSTK